MIVAIHCSSLSPHDAYTHANAVNTILGNHRPPANIYPVNPCTGFLQPQVENPTPQRGGEHLTSPWELIVPPRDRQEAL